MPGKIFDFLIDNIHGGSPYAGFDTSAHQLDLMGWGQHSPIFDTLIEEVRPTLVIEVGTWLGASAVKMAAKLKSLEIDCTVLCVDTWLGSAFHWRDPESREYLGLKNGYPTLYYQFLANIILSGHQDTIIPLPLSSLSASDWLRDLGVSSELIYIDADHEAEAVFTDINSYWKLRTPEGVMFGDDYHPAWPGVQSSVQMMAKRQNIELQIYQEKWVLGLSKKLVWD